MRSFAPVSGRGAGRGRTRPCSGAGERQGQKRAGQDEGQDEDGPGQTPSPPAIRGCAAPAGSAPPREGADLALFPGSAKGSARLLPLRGAGQTGQFQDQRYVPAPDRGYQQPVPPGAAQRAGRHPGLVPGNPVRRVRCRPVRFGGELFDSRGYFQRRNSTAAATEINALEIGQLYLDADLSAFTGEGSKSSITAGRQTKNVGSRRLISRQQFRNTINAYTGVSFDWQGANKDRMTLLWFMPHTRLPGDVPGLLDNEIVWDRESLDLQLFGGSYTFANVFGGTLEVYGYGLYEQDAPGSSPATGACSRPAPGWPAYPSPASSTGISKASTRRVWPATRRPSPIRATSMSRPSSSTARSATPSTRPGCRGSRCNTIRRAATAPTPTPITASIRCSAPGASSTAPRVSTGRSSAPT